MKTNKSFLILEGDDTMPGNHSRSIMHMDTDQYLFATSGEDSQEAMQAFFEKRPGVFRGN